MRRVMLPNDRINNGVTELVSESRVNGSAENCSESCALFLTTRIPGSYAVKMVVRLSCFTDDAVTF